ncbi:Hypothetical predicted protein [Pelobates cultripes]|uniref:Uncharacterized protein n=1 Tax=Pelobates cultripes TaxID=61616 RepID=A0AAD1STV2_PELCU|nr:Hypothetical predicted protein [Pelobates cultripes]
MRGGKKKKKTSIKKEDGKRKQQQEEEQQWTAVQDQRNSIKDLLELQKKDLPPGKRLSLRVALQRLNLPIAYLLNGVTIKRDQSSPYKITGKRLTLRVALQRLNLPIGYIINGVTIKRDQSLGYKITGKRLTLRMNIQRLKLPIGDLNNGVTVTRDRCFGFKITKTSSDETNYGKKRKREDKKTSKEGLMKKRYRGKKHCNGYMGGSTF